MTYKKSSYRAFNAVFGKIGRVASANVVVEFFTKTVTEN